MYYNDNYFGGPIAPIEADYSVSQPQQQQQGMGINPAMIMQGFEMFGGGAGAGGTAAAGEAGTAAAAGGEGAMSALASNPVGWIAAAMLGQNIAHNKGISSWQAGLKGQGGANIGDHYMLDKWGMEEGDPLYDLAGALGWGSGGGIFNPSYLNKKIFGETD